MVDSGGRLSSSKAQGGDMNLKNQKGRGGNEKTEHGGTHSELEGDTWPELRGKDSGGNPPDSNRKRVGKNWISLSKI